MVRLVDRRQFLRLSALGTAPWVRGGRAEARQGAGDPVVVIGAGLAGLRAATLLRRAGRRVVVLEARAEPGGRVRTLRGAFDGDLHGELGAVRVIPAHRTVLELVRQHGLQLVPFASSNGSSLVSVRGQNVRIPDDLGALVDALDLAADERGLTPAALLRRYVGNLPAGMATVEATAEDYARWQQIDAVSWPEWLRQRGASAGAVTLMTLGGDSRDLSALYVLRQYALLRGAEDFYKIHGGMDLLPRRMAEALGDVVRYRAAVDRIDQRGARVRVEFGGPSAPQSVYASRVIVAVPFSTFRRIDVQPALSAERRRTIENLTYFPAVRFLVETGTPFWHESGLSGSARTDDPAEVWDSAYDQAGTRGLLGVTIGGELGERLGATTSEEASATGSELVTRTFAGFSPDVLRTVVHRWSADPWARGAFAVFRPGRMSSAMPGIGRPEDRVHFAGEHTSPWVGWMEGALESGERAAREVLAS